jgi:hypothetical protein
MPQFYHFLDMNAATSTACLRVSRSVLFADTRCVADERQVHRNAGV